MLKVENLTFCYGPHKAIEGLHFEVKQGQLVGFLGPNGAGKTTTMNLITGLTSPSEGDVKIQGVSLFEHPIQVKKNIGFLPEHPPLYLEMTVFEYLTFVAQIKGVENQNIKAYVEESLELVHLREVQHRPIHKLSKGYRQRVGLAQALVAKPALIVLDEPTVGFDPQQVNEFKKLLLRLRGKHTVIWSTHILADVESTCDEVIVINKGRMVAFGPPGEIKKGRGSSKELLLYVKRDSAEFEDQIKKMSGVLSVVFLKDTSCYKIEYTQFELSDQILEAAAHCKVGVVRMESDRQDLQSLFLELTGNETVGGM